MELETILDQVSSHPILFHFNGLILRFSAQFLRIRGRNVKTRVYAGCSSLGRIHYLMYMGCNSLDHVHDLMYVGKENHAHIYESLYVTVIRVSAYNSVRKFFDKNDSKFDVSSIIW
jgi:hypothetical protein